MNTNGLADAIEHVRKHDRLPTWDERLRGEVRAVIASRLSSDEKLAALGAMLIEWEAAHG